MTTLKDDLVATRQWLETHTWGRGFKFRRAEPDSYCVMESAEAAIGWPRDLHAVARYEAVDKALLQVMGREPVIYNDDIAQSKDDVLAMIDKAIKAQS